MSVETLIAAGVPLFVALLLGSRLLARRVPPNEARRYAEAIVERIERRLDDEDAERSLWARQLVELRDRVSHLERLLRLSREKP